MKTIGFIRLINNIFRNDPPDVAAIERQGLLAIKIGQTFATRIDFLSVDRCDELSKLFRASSIIPGEDAMELLNSYTDEKWRTQFENIDTNPLASASVGQVHAATLRDGEDVVVKMIKGNFKQQFEKDVRAVKRLMKTVIFFYPTLERVADPVGILNHIEDYTTNELNLKNEIEGHNTLQKIYEENKDSFDLGNLRFAKLYPELSSENVLVSERLHGKTFDELLNAGEMSYDQLLELFHIHGFYLFGPGVFHGDIHPGNIIYQDGKIYFIDTGAIGRVGDKIRVGLFDFFTKLSAYDYDGCAHFLNKMASKEIEGKQFDEFHKKFVELYADFTNSTVSEVSLTTKMMQTIKLGVRSGMVFEKGMFSIIKSMMYLDGMVLKANPNAVLMKDMRQYIEEFKPFVKGSRA